MVLRRQPTLAVPYQLFYRKQLSTSLQQPLVRHRFFTALLSGPKFLQANKDVLLLKVELVYEMYGTSSSISGFNLPQSGRKDNTIFDSAFRIHLQCIVLFLSC